MNKIKDLYICALLA